MDLLPAFGRRMYESHTVARIQYLFHVDKVHTHTCTHTCTHTRTHTSPAHNRKLILWPEMFTASRAHFGEGNRLQLDLALNIWMFNAATLIIITSDSIRQSYTTCTCFMCVYEGARLWLWLLCRLCSLHMRVIGTVYEINIVKKLSKQAHAINPPFTGIRVHVCCCCCCCLPRSASPFAAQIPIGRLTCNTITGFFSNICRCMREEWCKNRRTFQVKINVWLLLAACCETVLVRPGSRSGRSSSNNIHSDNETSGLTSSAHKSAITNSVVSIWHLFRELS